MKIHQLTLNNFRGLRQLDLPLEPGMTVLVGVNGAGKSAVLDALAILLSWVVARIRQPSGSGRTIRELDIRNRSRYAVIRARTIDGPHWQLARNRPGHARIRLAGEPELQVRTELDFLSEYAKPIRQRIADTDEHCNIPLFAYYPVNRAVLDIPLRIRKSHDFRLLEAYDDALTSGANFRSYFEWFRNREDLENENLKYRDQLIRPDDWQYPDPQLEAVRKALRAFLAEFEQFSVRRNPLRMTVLKRGEEVRVDQLSDGEKCLIALIADLARRLAIANPALDDPLQGEGVVLIDEIDLHLHPAWQRMVLPKLVNVFPDCQFVVSTHSPQALGEVAAEQIRMLQVDQHNDVSFTIPEQAKGLTSNEILDELRFIISTSVFDAPPEHDD